MLDREGMIPTVAWALSSAPPVYALDARRLHCFSSGGMGHRSWSCQGAWRISTCGSDFRIGTRTGFCACTRRSRRTPLGPRAAGLWIGLSPKYNCCRHALAVLEGIALRAVELIESLGAAPDKAISVDGGLSSNQAFIRFLADALGRPVCLRHTPDLTALGAAELGFIGLGSKPPARSLSLDRIVAPGTRSAAVRAIRPAFSQAIQASRAFGQLTSASVDSSAMRR